MTGQSSLNFDARPAEPRLPEAARVKPWAELEDQIRVGMDRSNSKAKDEPWYQDLPPVLSKIMRVRASFTADEVWEALEKRGHTNPAHKAGLGTVFMRLKRAGYLENGGHVQSTRLTEACHAKVHVLWLVVKNQPGNFN